MPALLPFACASLLPALLLLLACGFGGIWPALAVTSITVMVFVLDRRTGDDWAKPADASGHMLSLTIGLVHFIVLAACVRALAMGAHLSVLDKVLVFTAAGLWLGQISNSNAHELIHRSSRAPRRLGVAVYASLLFGHHASAHPKVHHVHAATDRDPNSARAGEGFYRYLLRAWGGSFVAGWQAENAARARRTPPLPLWRHPYIGYIGGALAAVAAAAVLAGSGGVIALLGLAAYAQVQLFLSDYIQHYGLRRRVDDTGRTEPVGPQHSWNAPHWYSSAMMLNAPRHSDHHMHPGRSFPELALSAQDMPILPHSLPVMACIALVPGLWRKVMDRRAAKWAAP